MGKDPVPVVLGGAPEDSAAACLTALVRAAGRPISSSSVAEAFAAAPETRFQVAIPAAARSFGLECRMLEVPLDELRALDAPILALVEGGRVVVIESRSLRGWRVMDPLRARVLLRDDELRAQYVGVGFEVRDATAIAPSASLPERVGAFARGRAGAVARLGAVTLILQALVMGMSLVTALAIQRVFPMGDRPLLSVIVSAGAALTVAFALMQQLQGRAIEHLRAHFDRELLDQLVTHVLKLPIAFFDRFPPGEVLQRLQAFENVRSLFSTQGVAALLSVASVVVGAVLMASFAPKLFFVVPAVLVVYAVATWVLFPALRRIAVSETEARGKQQDRLIEILQGIVTLRMAGEASVAQQRWLPSFVEELAAGVRRDRTLAIATPALDACRGLALVASVWLGTRGVLTRRRPILALIFGTPGN